MAGGKAVVFDLDGTLLDTLVDIANAANDVLTELRFPLRSLSEFRVMVGDGVSVLFERCIPLDGREGDTLGKAKELFEQYYQLRWNEHSRPYDGIESLLDSLAQLRIPMAVLSNKPHAFTVRCVTELLGRWKFDPVFGQQDSIPRKPDPTLLNWIVKQWNLPAKDVLYIGDTNTDMATALAGGCFPVGVKWGFRTAEELVESGAAALLERPDDLLAFLSCSRTHRL